MVPNGRGLPVTVNHEIPSVRILCIFAMSPTDAYGWDHGAMGCRAAHRNGVIMRNKDKDGADVRLV